MILPAFNQSFALHASNLFGQTGSLHFQIVRHLLTVEWNVKRSTVLLKRYRVQVGEDAGPNALGRRMKASSGQHQVFPGGDAQQIPCDVQKPWFVANGTIDVIDGQKQNAAIFIRHDID